MAESVTCPRCGRTSYHPKDIEEGYCGACHDWTSAHDPWRVEVIHPTKEAADGADQR